MSTRKLSLVCVSVCVLLLGVSAANADLLNPSFELPALETNGYAVGAGDNWTLSTGTGAYLLNGNNGAGDGINAPAVGNQYVETTAGYSEAQSGIWQNTGTALQPGYLYTLSFQVNPGKFTTLSGAVVLEAANNTTSQGTTFASADFSFSDLTASTWTTKTVSGVYTGDPGKYLSTTVHFDGAWAGIDALSLSITTPEPSTIILLTTGLFGLLAYAWRKRK